jgi:PAS domain S-box-containing protein
MAKIDRRYAEQIVATVSQPIIVMTSALEVELVNEAFCRTFEVTAEESENLRLYDLGNGQWDIPELRKLLHEVLSERDAVIDYRVEHDFQQIGKRTMLLNARRLARESTDDRIVLAINDITEREQQLHELEGRREFAEKLIDSVRRAPISTGSSMRSCQGSPRFPGRRTCC